MPNSISETEAGKPSGRDGCVFLGVFTKVVDSYREQLARVIALERTAR